MKTETFVTKKQTKEFVNEYFELKAEKKRFRFLFAWYDIWVGVFVDTKKGLLYVFPVPMFGFVFRYRKPNLTSYDLEP